MAKAGFTKNKGKVKLVLSHKEAVFLRAIMSHIAYDETHWDISDALETVGYTYDKFESNKYDGSIRKKN